MERSPIVSLLQIFFIGLFETIRLGNKYDTIVFSESKKLLWDLIVAAHDQSHVAVASEDHLRYIEKFINEKTNHSYEVLCIMHFVAPAFC